MQRGIFTLILHRPFILRYPAALSLTEFKRHVERASIHRGTSLTNVVGAGLLAWRRRLPEQAGLGFDMLDKAHEVAPPRGVATSTYTRVKSFSSLRHTLPATGLL